MNLFEILSEIEVGYNNSDKKSETLRNHVDEIRTLLEENGAILENQVMSFRNEKNDLEGGRVFLQGSYAISTAIKHRKFEVDADIAFASVESLDLHSRERIYKKIKEYSDKKGYRTEFKKPCITIDFGDSYKIDLAIYSYQNNSLFHHNSINGHETKTLSYPKELIGKEIEYLKKYSDMRRVLRLTKHFIGNARRKLNIDECDKIPSISLMIYAMNHYLHSSMKTDSDKDLQFALETFVNGFSDFVMSNGINGPKDIQLNIPNTFYKVKNIVNVNQTLAYVKHALKNENYSEIVSERVFQSLRAKESVDHTPSLTGTMG